VDGIWLNPFFESPFLDAGYDISDYYRVATRYGTNEDAKQLFAEAHRRGMKVLFDFVPSYTSIEHPWFQASARQEKNPYTNWYIWTDNAWENLPDSMKDRFIQGYSRRDGQFMRNFYWSQPALNFGFAEPERPWQLPVDHPDVIAMREELKRVVRFWMDLGADGFRADMAGALVKTAAPQGWSQRQGEGTMAFWREIREILERDYPGSFMVSEWSFPMAAIAGGFHADFYHWFDGFNDLFQKESWRILNGRSEGYSFFDQAGKGNITKFLNNYLWHLQAVKERGYISIPIGNHDLARLTIQRTDDELELIFAFLLTLPGIPFIYYGNEIGMRQLYDLPNVEGAYPPRSGARSPMQWSAGKNAGFSEASAQSLYLPVDSRSCDGRANAGEDFPNVAAQESDPGSLLNRVRKLIRLKKQEQALAAYGEFVPLFARENCYPFVYARAAGNEIILVALNPAGENKEAAFTANIDLTEKKLLAGKEIAIEGNNNRLKLTIPGQTYAIYKCSRTSK
ncbi:MAG TPA: alpha-amylase family glycosyl hydrolase, partial [Bacillota bacterium]|nr:alpha-amylase family glycosyl hydrolase [Bacillota bacterium]